MMKQYVMLGACFAMCAFGAEPVDPSTLTGKIMAGYQGWFRTPGDGADQGFTHYAIQGKFEPGFSAVEMWPDMSEMDEDEKFATPFKHADGSTAYVFSSVVPKTVMRHFKWMEENGLDGVFLQRFIGGTKNERSRAQYQKVMSNVRAGAEKHSRAWAMMYDLSGGADTDVPGVVIADWKRLVDEDKIRKDRMYLHHNGKPVVSVWGIGFNDRRRYTLAQCLELITFLKDDPVYGGNTVMIGIPTYWRTLTSDTVSDPLLHEIAKKADIISPWAVGRFHNLADVQKYLNETAPKDLAWCKEQKKEFLPVAYAGFSWYNLMKGRNQLGPPSSKLDFIPRLKGEFLKAQLDGHIGYGATMIYQAMFDEIDEGTAIFKVTNTPPSTEATPFLGYEGLPSDFYMKMVGEAAKRLRAKLQIRN
jgi:hypothetical protein